MRPLLRGAHSLKDKRRVIRSLKDRISNKFSIAVAEVDHQDVCQAAEIGVVTVGTDTRFVQSVLTNVIKAAATFRDVELLNQEIETYGG